MPANSPAVSSCPVERAIHVIGGKWKLLVLRSLLLGGPQRYNDLLASVTGISAKELTRNLKELRLRWWTAPARALARFTDSPNPARVSCRSSSGCWFGDSGCYLRVRHQRTFWFVDSHQQRKENCIHA